jgi:hypothetical protein
LVATGQVGRRPTVCVWDCSCLASQHEERARGEESTHPYPVDDKGLVARSEVVLKCEQCIDF